MGDQNISSSDLFNWTNNSVIDLEKELMRRRAKLLLQLKDPILYREFMEFMSSSKSTRFVFILNLVYTFLFSPPIILNLVFGSKKLFWISCIEVVLMGLAILSGWLLYVCMKEDSYIRRRFGAIILSYSTTKSWKKLSDQIQAVLYLSLVVAMSLMMIRRTLEGNCSKTPSFIQLWSCNPSASYKSYPLDSATILMIIPIIFSCVMRETRIGLSMAGWSIVVFTLIYCTCLLPSPSSVFRLVVYAIVSFVIMLDSFKQYLLLFMLSRQLKRTIEANQRLADQNKTTEMRHLIANVAHDLKTPLSSFMSGIDLISAELTDLIERIQLTPTNEDEVNPEYLTSFISGLQSYISNIRNTNSFMLMTINRCLDYTKASNGLKLVPKYETMELADVLQMPLQCMTNIQQRIKITLLPYSEQGICSHIITDKQWLQENILCLLSNAVKYSAGGEVWITVSRTKKAKQEEQEDRIIPLDIPSMTVKTEKIGRKFIKQPTLSKKESWMTLASNWMASTSQRTYMSMKKVNVQSRYGHNQNRIIPTLSNDLEQQEITNLSPIGSINSLQKTEERPESTKTVTEKLSLDSSKLSRQLDASNFPDDEELLFEVTDSGIGVPEESIKTLFNPFRQTQKLAGGTGLGLYSLAKRIETLKGSYGVRHREDGKQGSVFWFTIPYKPDLLTAAHCMPSREELMKRRSSLSFNDPTSPVHTARIKRNQSTMGRTDSQNSNISNNNNELNILLAEDTLSIAKMTKLLLQRQRHQVTVAENGQMALDLLSERRYDVVLMDLQMPVMDGLEATRRIRARERERVKGDNDDVHEHQIVIGVSANSDSETMEEGLRAGIDDFLPKPFSIEAFIGVVRRTQERYTNINETTIQYH